MTGAYIVCFAQGFVDGRLLLDGFVVVLQDYPAGLQELYHAGHLATIGLRHLLPFVAISSLSLWMSS